MKDYTRRHRQTLYAEALAVIDARVGEILTLEDVARAIATSRRQLQRVMREVGHESFRDLVTTRRLEHAADMLLDGLPVVLVAQSCGYSHVSHFSRAFKRRFGVAPSRWAAERLCEREQPAEHPALVAA